MRGRKLRNKDLKRVSTASSSLYLILIFINVVCGPPVLVGRSGRAAFECLTMASIPICSKVFHKDSMKRRHESASALNVLNDKVLPFQCMFDGPESDNELFCIGTPLNSSSKVSPEIRGYLGQLKTLDSYFEKLENKGTIKVDHGSEDGGRGWHVETALGSFKPGKNILKKADGDNSEPLLKEKAGFGSLDRYFRRFNSGEELQNAYL